MKKLMTILPGMMLLCGLYINDAAAQSSTEMNYEYDESGNRVARTRVTFQRSESLDSGSVDLPEDSLAMWKHAQSDPEPAQAEKTTEATNDMHKAEVRPNVYPNPTGGMVTVDLLYNLYKTVPDQTQVSVYDSKHTLIRSFTTSGTREHFDISTLASGKYLVIIRSAKSRHFFSIQKN
jgi:hypothetical protein